MNKYWEYPFGITEEDKFKYQLSMPYKIIEFIVMGELMESRDFGMWGIEELYGIRWKSQEINFWFTVKRGNYERINWLGIDKCGEFIAQAIVEELIREERL